jgi:Asp-tRNA(Asn)/Glu-tRNA(Gln) amidotransferase B subunit
MLAGQTYCQYPKTKVINGDTIVLLLKKQADEINNNFVNYNKTIDSQLLVISLTQSKFDSLFNRFSLINCDTTQRMREIYDVNERLINTLNANNKLFRFFDTCTRRELKFYQKYKITTNEY